MPSKPPSGFTPGLDGSPVLIPETAATGLWVAADTGGKVGGASP